MPYDGGESPSIPPALPHRGTSSPTATVPRRSIANRHVKRRLHMSANRKLHSSKLFGRSGLSYTPYHMMVESRPLYLLLCLIGAPLRLQRRYHADPLLTGTSNVVCIGRPSVNYTVASSLADQGFPTDTIPYDGGESTSIPPALPHRGTSSATATVPRRSIANRHVKRRLHRCANRKLHSSKLFGRSGLSYTPYHMMVESRPLYLLLCLIGAPLRLTRRYHADLLLTGTSNVVCIGRPSVNYTVASSLADQGFPTHHTI